MVAEAAHALAGEWGSEGSAEILKLLVGEK